MVKDLCVLRPIKQAGLTGGMAKEIMTGQARRDIAVPRSRAKSTASTFAPTNPPFFIIRTSMTNALYASSIPLFKQMLGGLKGVLAKAEAHAVAKNIDPNALLQARLYPDMFPLLKQVQVATDFAKGVAHRLAGAEVPAMDDGELTFADLQARIDKILALMDGLDAAQFEGAATREIVTQAGTPKEKRFTGQSYLLNYGLPHFFFHTTTAYDILRHNGVEVGKRDYIGTY
jgi:hypothetical protein